MHLLAPTVLRVAPAELPARVRASFGAELRRAGGFAQLCLLGAHACLDVADAAGGEGALGVLWASRHGAVHATRAALADGLARGEPAMPFTFIATQPHLAGALLAQRSHPVVRSACLYLAADAWPWLLRLARAWLADCERVLVGWVEESTAEGVAHQSDWCLFQERSAAGSIRCEAARENAIGVAATTENWLVHIAAWRAQPQAPLLLRGADDAWRFTAEG